MPTQQVHHPLFARFYARLSAGMESAAGKYRDQLLAGLTGSVLEVGAGNGLNFSHYPPTVSGVVAVEPERYLRAIAEANARQASVPVVVTDGTADKLPADDGAFDAVVASLVLCSVPDQAVALAEMRRVLRPGGQLRFMEHVRAEKSGHRRLQQVLDATVWPVCFGGCHAGRDTLAAIAAAGFSVTEVQKYRLPDGGPPWPTTPHVRGAAVRT